MCMPTPTAAKERLPILHLAFLCAVEASFFYTICSIFSFAGILSVDLGWAPDRNQAGFVAGWLQSSNVCGRILTSTAWGFVASRCGIKIVLSITSASLLIGGLIFGFCTNLTAAMSVRFVFFGLLNGWMVMVGPCAIAVAGRERQTEVLGLIFAAGCGMQLIGPAVGGWTYGLVEDFPALLPSLIGCGLCVAALVLLLLVRKTFSPEASETARESGESDPSLPKSSWNLICQRPLPLILFMRFAGGCASYTMYEAVPLWLISDHELGGLEMSEKSVGSLLCRSGLWNTIYFTWLLPWFSNRFGSRYFSIVTSLIALVTACCLPFSPNTALANVLHLVCASALVSNNVLNVAFTNNATSPEDRFIANGLAVTSETVGKAVGPIAASSIFAWTIKNWGWQGHGIVFYMLAGLAMIQILCVLCLPSYVESASAPEIGSKEGKTMDANV